MDALKTVCVSLQACSCRYVEMRLGSSEQRQTRVILKTLSPQWDEEYCLRMAVSEDLSQHQLMLTVWDHDVRKVTVAAK